MTGRERRDWYRARPGYWFRPKYFGYGATPVTWQGWLASLVVVLVSLPIAFIAAQRNLTYLVLLVPVLAIFMWVCRIKTDGDWKWRSGGE